MYRIQSRPLSFAGRVAEEKRRLEAEIVKAKPGPTRSNLEKKLRQLGVAAHINQWLSSPGLQAPR